MSRGPAPWKSSDVAWRGGRRPYDLVREVIVSGVIVAVIVLGLTVLFASPDPPAVTFQEWSTDSPKDFLATTLSEINQTSLSATYGPPYQTTAQDGSTQGFGPFSPERWFGQQIPVNTFEDYVARPLSTAPDPDGTVAAALEQWRAATSDQQTAWSDAYKAALAEATLTGGYDVAGDDAGPLGTILQAQFAYAVAGGLDNAIVANATDASIWYSNDQTFALLYFGDSGQGGGGPDCISPDTYQQDQLDPAQVLPEGTGCWYYNLSVSNDAPRYAGYLAGNTWGIINEVGNWPGAWWLFPYTFWYQWGPGLNGASADLWAMVMTAVVSLPFLFLPWIPGLRAIPKKLGLYKVMWSDYYALVKREQGRKS